MDNTDANNSGLKIKAAPNIIIKIPIIIPEAANGPVMRSSMYEYNKVITPQMMKPKPNMTEVAATPKNGKAIIIIPTIIAIMLIRVSVSMDTPLFNY